jgi:hypothetical protein
MNHFAKCFCEDQMQPGENQIMVKPMLLSKVSKSTFKERRNSPVSYSWRSLQRCKSGEQDRE